MKTLLKNRKALYNYELLDTYTAGIKLLGEEVKALKEGRGNLIGSFIKDKENALYLTAFHLPQYSKSSNKNYNPNRDRKLLLNKKEISAVKAEMANKGRTVVPLEVLLDKNLIKVKIAVVKGRGKSDKKQYLKEKDIERQTNREIKEMGY